MLIPLPPGGGVDIYAKLVADHMAKTLHRTIVIEHKPGGSGNTGLQYVAHEPADGNLIIVATQGMTEINPVAYADTRWSLADFIPLIRGVQAPLVLVANPAIPAKTVEELVAWVRKNPGKLSYSSYGAGRSSHFLGFLFNKRFGLDLAHLPSKEGRAQAAELVANRTLFGFAQLQPTLPLIRDKKLNAIAVTSPQRSRFFPDVPTFAELGQPDFTAECLVRPDAPQRDAAGDGGRHTRGGQGGARGSRREGEARSAGLRHIRRNRAGLRRRNPQPDGAVGAPRRGIRLPQRSRRRELTARPRSDGG